MSAKIRKENCKSKEKVIFLLQTLNIISYLCSRIVCHSCHRGGNEPYNDVTMETLDDIDLQILRILQKNAKLTTKEVADLVHLTPTPVFERQKRLERRGYIKKYVAVLDPEKLNQGLVVFCKVKLKQINHDVADVFMHRIQRIPEVTECYNTSGQYDYLLKVRAQDMRQYQEFVLNKLGTIESVGSIESTFVMSEVKQNYGINI